MTVKASDVIQACRELAEESPEAVYRYPVRGKGNLYTQGQAGCGKGCLIGQGLVCACPDFLPVLRQIDKEGSLYIDKLMVRLDIEHTAAEDLWLSCVQRWQDQMNPWSKCIALADEFAGIAQTAPES